MASSNPHDHYVRSFFSQPENALELFRAFLPQSVFSLFKPDSIRLIDATFIDEELTESRADLLFAIDVATSDNAVPIQVYVLFEHKSYKDDSLFPQLLKYLSRIYERQFNKDKRLYPVIPFVLYHGKNDWDPGTKFSDQFEHLPAPMIENLRTYLPDFQIEMLNLPRENIFTFEMADVVKAHLGVAKYNHSDDLIERLADILKVVSRVPVDQKIIDFLYTTTYYLYITKEFTPEALREAFRRARFEQSDYEAILMTTAERLREEGKIQGIKEGRQKGRQEGRQEGEQIGVLKGKIEDAMKMKEEGLAIDQILRITGLSLDDLKKAGVVE